MQSAIRSFPNALVVSGTNRVPQSFTRSNTSPLSFLPLVGGQVVVFNIVLVYGAELHKEGIKIVGDIPEGYPAPVNVFVSSFGDDFVKLLPTALIIAIVAFMESISVAKAMAIKYGNDLDSNQELVGLGAANVVGAFFNAFPSTGGFSRTSVNADAGARTPIAGLISAIILIITIEFLTPLFYYLPQVSLHVSV